MGSDDAGRTVIRCCVDDVCAGLGALFEAERVLAESSPPRPAPPVPPATVHRELMALQGAGLVTLLWRDFGLAVSVDPAVHPLAEAAEAVALGCSGGGGGGVAAAAAAAEAEGVGAEATATPNGGADPCTCAAASNSLGLHPCLFPLLRRLVDRHKSACAQASARLRTAAALLGGSAHGGWQRAYEAARGVAERGREEGSREEVLRRGVAAYLRGEEAVGWGVAGGRPAVEGRAAPEAGVEDMEEEKEEEEEGGGGRAAVGDRGAEAQHTHTLPPLCKPVPQNLLHQLSMDCATVVARMQSMTLPAELLASREAAAAAAEAGMVGRQQQHSASAAASIAGAAPGGPAPLWAAPSRWTWALPATVLLQRGAPPTVPSPLINGFAVARVLAGLASPLFPAREWRTSSAAEVGALWGRWGAWEFADVAEVAARVVEAFGRAT